MRRSITDKTLWKLAGTVFLLLFWQFLAVTVGHRDFILPGPRETFLASFRMLQGTYVYKCIFETLKRMVAGFTISFLIGLVLGCFAGNDERIRIFFEPFMTCLKAIPTASLVYLFIVLSGARNAPLYIVVLISLPIIYESVAGGIANLDPSVDKALRVDGGNAFTNTWKVKLPLAVPYIIVGMASSFTLSFKIEIMAEVITGYSKLGLGSAILASQRSDPTDMTDVFAYSLAAVLIVLLIDELAHILERKLRSSFE